MQKRFQNLSMHDSKDEQLQKHYNAWVLIGGIIWTNIYKISPDVNQVLYTMIPQTAFTISWA